MINALFSSKGDGKKLFQRGQHHGVFGWDSIVAMYHGEVGRAKQNLTRMVPRLKEVHVVRDSWILGLNSMFLLLKSCRLIVS